MFSLLILIDFILFIYVFISARWVGWNLEQALSSKTGFALLVFSAITIMKKGLTKPLRFGKILFVSGLVLLLASLAISLQVRKSQNFVIVEKERFDQSDEIIVLDRVVVQDTPGIVRNDVFAEILIGDKKETVKIMPGLLSDKHFWRIVRFGYTPVLSLTVKDDEVAKNQTLVLATENWTSNNEGTITEAGINRNPPPRIMLGVGHFPPEMEALLDFNQFGIQNENLFIRISKTTFEGRSVSLEGDDYWRYLVNGRLKNPVLKIALIKNRKTVKTREVKIGDAFNWGGKNNIKFNDLKYWVEIERRWDPFIPVIIISFLITYIGITISGIQHVANFFRSLRAKRVGKKFF